MSKRLVLGCACALMAVAGCGGGDNPGTDTGPGGNDGGTDAHTPTVDANIDAFHVPGADTGVDAFVAPGTDAGTDAGADAFVSPDAGMTDGCELGNTYPALSLHSLHAFGDLPVGIALAPGRDDLFVVLRGGRIVIMNPTTGAVGATPFLDVSSRLGAMPSGTAENGLLGLAFHPDYATNGLLYIAYTARVSGGAMPYDDRVAVAMRATADTATFGSDIFTIGDPASNHNGGQLGFGPDDGFLYYSVGDGGVQYDPMLHGQALTQNLGKIHRFRVGPGIATYEVPSTNPFATSGGNPTIWAYGLRNAWRFSWDRLTHALYVADVGQDAWEEVSVVPSAGGAGTNFGWSYCEGTHDMRNPTTHMLNYPGGCASLAGGTAPIVEYPHSGGLMQASGSASVVGGYVYRGAAIPALRGAYFFADTESSRFAVLRNCPGTPITPMRLDSISNSSCMNPVTFGEDRGGELLVSCLADQTIYRIASP